LKTAGRFSADDLSVASGRRRFPPGTMAQPVSEYIVRFLENLGVRHIFGIPGAHVLPLYDRLLDSSITTVLPKHEQGAAFMAGGYARAARRIGACVATAGPGATNLVTGLANAYVDRLPVLALTGETPTYSFGKGALQESSGQGTSIDQNRLFGGITRYHRIVERPDYLDQVFRKTHAILTGPDPGPVLLSFPYNVLREMLTEAPGVLESPPPPVGTGTFFDVTAAGRTVDLLRKSRRPVLLAGAGAVRAGAADTIRHLSATVGMPVATSLKARGILPEDAPLSLGVLGVTSRELAMRYVTERADLLILAGIGFGERTSYNWNPQLFEGKNIIRIDADPGQLNRALTPSLPVSGDVGAVLRYVSDLIDRTPMNKKANGLQDYRKRYDQPNIREQDFCLIKEFLQAFSRFFGNDGIVFDDNIIYMQNFVPVRHPDRYYPNTGISSLGHAIPAAIGARLSSGRPVAAVLGDGGFQMCGMELMTAVNHKIPITVVLINNSSLGLVRKNQHYNYKSRYISCDFENPDFALLAQSFGIAHWRVEKKEDIEPVLSGLFVDQQVNLIEVVMSKNDFPHYSSGR